jgi:hypothetical protein
MLTAEYASWRGLGAKRFTPSNTVNASYSPVVTETATGLTPSVEDGDGSTAFLEAFSGWQVQKLKK